MSQLLESIKLENGKYHNLFYHEKRMNRSLIVLFGEPLRVNLEEYLQQVEKPTSGLYKCRCIYDNRSMDFEFVPYQPAVITSLQLVESNTINYEHKFKDRKSIDMLFEIRNDCDDILIVKEGKITDSSFSNIIFKRSDKWFTPRSALLKGTMRQNLLERNDISEDDISVEGIKEFESFKLINAMVGFAGPEIDVSNIVY